MPRRQELPLARLDQTLRALADPTRLRILHLLAEGPLCVGDLVTALGVAQPTASRHLGYLRRSGLVEDEKRGLWCFYGLARSQQRQLASLVRALADAGHDVPELRADRAALDRLRRKGACCPQHWTRGHA